ncbi:helix-turn-helix domain-containing protein [Vibrio parahaemolyticus]|uniref:helix-turn-helix domain-containing protein n=1 Tax=Vibrio parahaemolyticus TaxID=670 RepID=UPI00111003C5|nr:helix-turn-helix transcriptional regulator [Vibrio parahaemolyticus]TMX34540.1 XRE family transcriptional regulator [Vibrio parahaemolyticus]TMX71370.1 XRE family transcriptional regulator [Vibrio parahaemolyticus]
MSTDNPIPKRLKEARKKMKISQKNLGISIGMEAGSASARMNQYERGVHTPDVSTLKLLAKELGVPLNYFFCEDDESAEIATAIAKLTSEQRSQVISFINTLCKKTNEN